VRGDFPRQTFFNLDSVIERISRVSVYVRTARDPEQLMPGLRSAVQRIDPNFVVWGMRTLDDQIGSRMANERMLSFLASGFAVLATVLGIVGLHGVLMFQVTNRTREVGIRMALGAHRLAIVGLIAGEMIGVVFGGIAVGVAIAYWCGRFVQAQLFGTNADDPLVFSVAVLVILTAATVATLPPALRASRIDPLQAIRRVS
jgi:ABC-type antimicrobial peptide transport system permease subunit